MRFKDFQNEQVHAQRQLNKLEEAVERRWLTPDRQLLLSTSVSVVLHRMQRPADEHASTSYGIHVSFWHEQEGAFSMLSDGRKIEGGYFEFEMNALHRLSAVQLDYVRKARAALEDWIDGKIDTLPLDLFG